MLTKGISRKAEELAETTEDLEVFIPEVIKYAEEVLAQTPEMLPVLKQAGVVDSGGQGLLEVFVVPSTDIMEKKWIIPSLRQLLLLRSQRFLLRQRQISNLDIARSSSFF